MFNVAMTELGVVDDTMSMSPVIPVFHKESVFRQPHMVCIKTVILNYRPVIGNRCCYCF